MEPGSSMSHSKFSPVIPILIRINPILRIVTYFQKCEKNINFNTHKYPVIILCLIAVNPSSGHFPYVPMLPQ